MFCCLAVVHSVALRFFERVVHLSQTVFRAVYSFYALLWLHSKLYSCALSQCVTKSQPPYLSRDWTLRSVHEQTFSLLLLFVESSCFLTRNLPSDGVPYCESSTQEKKYHGCALAAQAMSFVSCVLVKAS